MTMATNQAAAAAAKPKSLTRAALQVAATLAFSAYSLHYAWVETDQPWGPESPLNLAEENWSDNPSLRGRTLSVVESHPSACRIAKEFRLSKDVISPSYLASFDDRGIEVASNLVQALTGIATTNEINYAKRSLNHTVLFETHYPRHGALMIEEDDNFRGTILLLRNPISAILSSFNELRVTRAVTRTPIHAWIRYRDSPQFEAQVKSYEQFVTHWMDKYRNSREDLLILSYEGLTGGKGAVFTQQMGHFLKKSKGVNLIDSKSIECVWEKFVHDKWYQRGEAPPAATSFQERDDDRPFTKDQLLLVSRMLGDLNERFGQDEQFSIIMSSYLSSISSNISYY